MTFYYCERASLDFFGEPFNSITNIFFMITAFLVLRLYRDYISFFSIAFIGLSSFAFHTYQNSFTGLLDILAIIIFMLIYTTNIYKKLIGFNFFYSSFIALSFVISCYLFGILLRNSVIGTSSFYFPIIFHLLFLIIYFRYINLDFNYLKYLVLSITIFSTSIILRVIDQSVCNIFPLGTHFLWHMLNAIFLFFLIKFFYLVCNRSTPEKPT